ncbi:CpcT/CpeT family chromophore lyase [Sodalinema gerasimenkoae]
MQSLTPERLTRLCGCNFVVERQENSFTGVVEPGNQCCVERNGRTSGE